MGACLTATVSMATFAIPSAGLGPRMSEAKERPPDPLVDELKSALGDGYVIMSELGGGGMSRVFVAHDRSLGRDVVVKAVDGSELGRSGAGRFAREIRVAAALQDPHIVPLLSAGSSERGILWYTMPYVVGHTLRHRMRAGKLVPNEARQILLETARALAAAHAEGVVHRDVKPENVLLSPGGAMIADFGIAKALEESGFTTSALTGTGVGLGTPGYIAPEQAIGASVDSRADLYAWGVMAYEVLTGAHPFASATTPQAARRCAPDPGAVPPGREERRNFTGTRAVDQCLPGKGPGQASPFGLGNRENAGSRR